MKKAIFLLTFLTICSSYLISQSIWKIGFKAGPAISKSSIQPMNGTEKYGTGLSAGFDFYRFKKEHLFFKTGINYNLTVTNYSSVRNNDTTFEWKLKGSHATIPIMMGYRFNIKQHDFFAAAGFEIDYLFYSVEKSNLYGTYKWYSKPLDYLAPKYVLSIAYLNRINEHFTLTVNPEFSGTFNYESDRLNVWRLNFGIVYKY